MVDKIDQFLFKNYKDKSFEIRKKSKVFVASCILAICVFLIIGILELVSGFPLLNVILFGLSVIAVFGILIVFQQGKYGFASFLLLVGVLCFITLTIIVDKYNNPFEIYRYSFVSTCVLFGAGILLHKEKDILLFCCLGITGIICFYIFRYGYQLNMAFDKTSLISLIVCLVIYSFFSFMSLLTLRLTKQMIGEIEKSEKEATTQRDDSLRMLNVIELYTKPSIVQKVLSGENPSTLIPEKQELAILFCDIRNFTRISENMEPLAVVEFLNPYFATMNSTVIIHNGELDKIMGDCFMAIFEDPDDAVTAGIEISNNLKDYKEDTQFQLKNGIGIHYGEVIVGNIGSPWKLDYTVIGDVVNVASRLESLTKEYKTNLIISDEVKTRLKNEYSFTELSDIKVRGRSKSIKIFGLSSNDQG
jgi:class 3 adenylate cyclase